MQVAIILHNTPKPPWENGNFKNCTKTISSDCPPYTPTAHAMPNTRHATDVPQERRSNHTYSTVETSAHWQNIERRQSSAQEHPSRRCTPVASNSSSQLTYYCIPFTD